MTKYELLELDDGCFAISADYNNCGWIVDVTFEKNEKSYAEIFVKLLNEEVNKAEDNAVFELKQRYFDKTKQFLDC